MKVRNAKKTLSRFTIASVVSMFAIFSSAEAARIAIGPPASETNSVSRVILEAYGIGEGDYQAFQESFGNAADLVQDGNIDISFGILGVPAGSIESLNASTGDVVMLGLSDEVISAAEEGRGFLRSDISKAVNTVMFADIHSIATIVVADGY